MQRFDGINNTGAWNKLSENIGLGQTSPLKSLDLASNKKLTAKCILFLLSKYHLQTSHAVTILQLVL